jgi:hypothetical protein
VFRLFLHRLHREKPGDDLYHHQPTQTKYHFGYCWQMRPFVWKMSGSAEGRLEHVVHLHEVSASVACRSSFCLLTHMAVGHIMAHALFGPLISPCFCAAIFIAAQKQGEIKGLFPGYPEIQEQFLTVLHAVP